MSTNLVSVSAIVSLTSPISLAELALNLMDCRKGFKGSYELIEGKIQVFNRSIGSSDYSVK